MLTIGVVSFITTFVVITVRKMRAKSRQTKAHATQYIPGA